ncbi:hypothetical protein NE237_013583 [Protea cynaroides]|uniref:Uncharacterized protein n=1 Tax=Protea cynaroides TaxID=273540 RepID=A0A9Q0H2C7_9MAGN|nr:hypothetical protein NE237_013583 [Protea cynaroides]
MAPRVGQRDSRSTDVHSRDLQEMAQGRTHGSRVSMAADLLEAMKLCVVSGGSVVAAVTHPISHVRFFQVAATERHLASDIRIAGGRSMVLVTGKEKMCSSRGDPRVLSGFRRDVVESAMVETGAARSQLKLLNPGMEGFSKDSVNRDFLKDAQSESAEVDATGVVASEEGFLGFENSGPGRIGSWI